MSAFKFKALNANITRREIPETKKAYWAGFFDGEGSVGVYWYNRGKHAPSFRATISQKRPHVTAIEEVAEVYGGCLTGHAGDCLQVQLSNLHAYEFLSDILPYCSIKNSQIELFIGTVDSIRDGREVDLSEVVSQMSSLKKGW